MFLVGLAIIAAVNADVSHLLNNNRGYNYPQPGPSFQDQLSLPVPAPAPQQQYLPPQQPAFNPAPVKQFRIPQAPIQQAPVPAPFPDPRPQQQYLPPQRAPQQGPIWSRTMGGIHTGLGICASMYWLAS